MSYVDKNQGLQIFEVIIDGKSKRGKKRLDRDWKNQRKLLRDMKFNSEMDKFYLQRNLRGRTAPPHRCRIGL